MHEIQQKILNISKSQDISKLSLRELGTLIGETHPQKVKYHIQQLEHSGFLHLTKNVSASKQLKRSNSVNAAYNFVEIPILGEANCGKATIFAEESYKGSIKVSASQLSVQHNLFALIARGSSMNKASINGKTIEEGDYVIVDPDNRQPKSGKDYIVSVIDGAANIKKYFLDNENDQIVLFSETTDSDIHQPIFITSDEANDYLINGVVIQVIKNPKISKDV